MPRKVPMSYRDTKRDSSAPPPSRSSLFGNPEFRLFSELRGLLEGQNPTCAALLCVAFMEHHLLLFSLSHLTTPLYLFFSAYFFPVLLKNN